MAVAAFGEAGRGGRRGRRCGPSPSEASVLLKRRGRGGFHKTTSAAKGCTRGFMCKNDSDLWMTDGWSRSRTCICAPTKNVHKIHCLTKLISAGLALVQSINNALACVYIQSCEFRIILADGKLQS
jgi:hypothetical protein